ncbi:MAG: hypothetical protein NT136_02055 [Candidatus Moranbacteria bacterium]|nr:hypothetical protein [Candidatus Moranbacteria bacterium]
MTAINLSQPMQQGKAGARKVDPVDKGIYISLAVLIITLLIFGALKGATMWLNSETKVVNEKIAAGARNLEGKDVDRIADFQQRMLQIEKSISSEVNSNEMLKQTSQSMIQGSVVQSLKSTSGSLILEIASDNFLTAAKQVLSFKKSDYFNNVKVTAISRSKEGKVLITLGMNF